MEALVSHAPEFLSKAREIGIVTASFSGGQSKPGVERGPDVLLKSGLIEQLRSYGYNILGEGDMPRYNDWNGCSHTDSQGPSLTRNAQQVSMVTHDISKRTCAQATLGRTVLSIGGDHSVAIGTVSGVAKAMHEKHGKDLAVFWIDAHADLNTPATSSSGYIHGMPLAFLTGIAKAHCHGNDVKNSPFGWLETNHLIPTSKLVYIGLRDVDKAEWQHIEQHAIRSYTSNDVRSKGVTQVIDEALDYIGQDIPIHLGFDIDSLDPSIAPSTGLPVPEGLTMQDGLEIVTKIAGTGQLVAMDLVEFNPQIDPDGDGAQRTAAAGEKTVIAAFTTRR